MIDDKNRSEDTAEYTESVSSDQENENDIENADEIQRDEVTSATDITDEYTESDDDSIFELDDDELTEEDYQDSESDEYEISADKRVIEYIRSRVKSYFSSLKGPDAKKKRKKLAVVLVIALLVLLVVTDFIPILPNAYNRFYVGNKYTLSETKSGAYDKIGDCVLYASNGKIFCFGPDMDVEYEIDSFSGTPCVRTDHESAVVYCPDTVEAVVFNGIDSSKRIRANDALIRASVNSSGGYVLVSAETGFAANVSAFSSDHKKIYEWHTSSKIVDAVLSPDSKYMCIAYLEPKDDRLDTNIMFFDTSSESPVDEIRLEGNVIAELKFLNNDTVLAVGSTATLAFTGDGFKKWQKDYDGKLLKTFDISNDGDIAFIFNRYNSELSESTVELYNLDGKNLGKYSSDSNVRYVSANNGYFLLSLDRETVLLDDDADVCESNKLSYDCGRTVLYENYNFGFSINGNVAEIISVNH